MKIIIILFCLLIINCCPTLEGPPGDTQSQEWSPSDLPSGSSVVKIIDCDNEQVDSLSIRESYVIIRNCIVNGNIRIWGMAKNANSIDLIKESKLPGYIKWLRSVSPTQVRIENTTIHGNGTIPLYIGPGVTFTVIDNVTIDGLSDSTMIYFGAESYGTSLINSNISGNPGREMIAIDASSHNFIDSNIISYKEGGIFLYRNCGENGTIRHTTPSYNVISNNYIIGNNTAVFLGSREGNRCYCQEDAGYTFGSSISDMDHSRYNIISNNYIGSGSIKIGEYSDNNILQ